MPDVVFELFMNVSSVASELLSNKNIHAFKQDALSVVYTKIKSNVELQESSCALPIMMSKANHVMEIKMMIKKLFK